MASQSFALPSQLSDFTVTVACTRTPAAGTVTDDGVAMVFYTLVATACNITSGGGCPNGTTTEPTYAERQLTRGLTQ
ncbi:MAG: hypothetical protein EOP39_08095 [Rubrivivax sp.]|nr:MAG: hypothetical protein EOP39_08095 [Rubrivivax sp.]